METDWYARFRYKYKMDLRGKWLKGQSGIGLAAECEWIMTETAISDDFEKLLYFKAPLKHFIFRTRREVQSLKFRESMQAIMDWFTHHVEGEPYILFEVRGQHAYGYRYEVHSTGKLPPVAFQENQWISPQMGMGKPACHVTTIGVRRV